MSMKFGSEIDTGLTMEEIPNTKKMLKIFDPTTFPMAMSTFFFLTAAIDVASSGREVPMETIVNPINL